MKTYKTFFIAVSLLLVSAIGAYAEGTQTLADLLRGQYSGVRVSSHDGSLIGGTNVYIRGVNSIRTSSAPLIVVDGVYINADSDKHLNTYWTAGEGFRVSPHNPFLSLNLNDIKSIEVLKNISQTALYGSEGANGVILITTRNAESERLDVNWNSDVSLAVPSRSINAFGLAVSHQHNVNVSMSRGGVRYYLSGWFNDLNGLSPASSSTYGGLRLNFESTANKFINVGLNTNISLGNISSTTGAAWAGAPSYVMAARAPQLFGDDSQEDWLNGHDDDTRDRRALASAWIRLNFTPHLHLHTTVGADYGKNTRYLWYGNETYYGSAKNGAASVISSDLLRYRINSTLEFARYFSKHHLDVSLGYEATGIWSKFNTMYGADFFSHELRGLGMSYAAQKGDIHEFDDTYSRQGFVAGISYDWNGVVGADVLFRADVLREYTQWTPYTYPAANVYFDLHKAFMPDLKALSSLKISAGYGHAGYDEAVPYQTLHKYVGGYLPSVPSGAENYHKPLFRINTKEWNASFNVGFMDERLGLGVTYYDKLTDDTMTMTCVGVVDGFFWVPGQAQEILSRTSSISNKGFEFDLFADIIRTKDLTWSVSANLSYNINQMYSVDIEDRYGAKINATELANRNVIGYPVGALYGYAYAGGKHLDVTGNGVLTGNDKVIIGNPIPVYVGGFNSSLRYRNFSFDFAFDGAAGHDILNLTRMYTDDDPTDLISAKYVEKGDFLRLKSVGFAYTIPFKKKWIESLKVKLTGMNLCTLTGYSGWNPDVNVYGASPMTAGIDYGSWPQARTVTLGISVDF